MAYHAYELSFTSDLNDKPKILQLPDQFYQTDGKADIFSVSLVKDGAGISVTGSCVAKLLTPVDELLTWSGTRSGNVLTATLPKEAYAAPGRARLSILLVNGDEEVTVFCADLKIARNASATEVVPAQAVPDLTTLLAKISACEQATTAANAAAAAVPNLVAPTFSTGTAYSAGSYVYHNGNLYRFTSDHAAGEWIGTDAVAVKLGQDVGDLKSAIIKYNSWNVLDQYVFPNSEHKGITYTRIANGGIHVQGTATADSFCNLISNVAALPDNVHVGDVLFVKNASTDIPFAICISTDGVNWQDTLTGFNTDSTYTVPNNAVGFMFKVRVPNGRTVNADVYPFLLTNDSNKSLDSRLVPVKSAVTALQNKTNEIDNLDRSIKEEYIYQSDAQAQSSNYYKKYLPSFTKGNVYMIRLTVGTAGTYELKLGTAASGSSMVDVVGSATVQANVPYDFIGYTPSQDGLNFSRLSVSTSHSIKVYRLIKETDLLNATFTNFGQFNDADIFPFSEVPMQESVINGITFARTGAGKYTVSGTSSALAQYGIFYADTLPDWIVPGKTYKLQYNGTNNIQIEFLFTTDGLTWTSGGSFSAIGEITIPSNATGMRIRFNVPSGVTVNKNVQIRLIGKAEVPPYYAAHMDSKAKQINAITDECGLKGDCFVFMTDYHRQANTKNSASLVKYILEHTGTRFVVFGGDTQDYEQTFEAAMKETSGMYADYGDVLDRFYSVRGNHEYNYHYVRDEGYPTSIMPSYDQIYRVENKRQEKDYVSISPLGDICIDNKIQKIRYYFIGCDKNIEIENESRKWLFDDFLTIPDGYNIIVFSHKTFDISEDNLVVGPRVQSIVNAMNAVNTKGSFTYSPSGTPVTYNYANVNAKALCIIGGHLHFDADSTEEVVTGYSSNILITCTTTDAYARQNSGGFNHNPLTRTIGTTSEQAFDVVNLDIENMKLRMTRIGAGSDRSFDLLPNA